jgi:hypothetical protein
MAHTGAGGWPTKAVGRGHVAERVACRLLDGSRSNHAGHLPSPRACIAVWLAWSASGCASATGVEASEPAAEQDAATEPRGNDSTSFSDAALYATQDMVDAAAATCSNPPVFRGPDECSSGPGCYVLSDEWHILGDVQKEPEATTCHFGFFPDLCGCDPDAGNETLDGGSDADATRGHPCPARETCVSVYFPPVSAFGPVGDHNICRALCLADTECLPGERCWGGYCLVPECVRDAECGLDVCGHCTQHREPGHVAEINTFNSPTCVYEGKCGPHSCAGCVEVHPYADLAPSHMCGL